MRELTMNKMNWVSGGDVLPPPSPRPGVGGFETVGYWIANPWEFGGWTTDAYWSFLGDGFDYLTNLSYDDLNPAAQALVDGLLDYVDFVNTEILDLTINGH